MKICIQISIQIVPKLVKNFTQNQKNLKYISKDFLFLTNGGISPNLVTLHLRNLKFYLQDFITLSKKST